MTSRERIAKTLQHKQPDRCPIDLGGSPVTGMSVSTLYRFRERLALPSHRLKVVDPFQMLGEIEEDISRLVGNDIIGLWNRNNMLGFPNDGWKPWAMDDGTPVYMGGQFAVEMDQAGNHLLYPRGNTNVPPSMCMPKNGYFFDNINRTESAFDFDVEPDKLHAKEDFIHDFAVATDEDARYWEDMSHALFEATDYSIMGLIGGAGFGDLAQVPGPAVEYPRGIRRIDDWLAAHVLLPEYIDEVFSYQMEIMMKNLEIYRQAVGDRIQVVYISGTDFGTQTGAFTSLETFRKLYKPYYTKINQWVHTHTNWKTFYHTCGCVNELLDDFVEMGMDCLNPVQFSAMEPAGMTPQRLKDMYGEKLIFWGGGVDTQRVLPFGTPEEVRSQVDERVRILGQDGGFVFSSTHNVVANVPTDNLVAMYETVLHDKLV